MTPERAAALIQSMIDLLNHSPAECLSTDEVCVEHSGHDGGVHRVRKTDVLCYAVTVREGGQVTHSYYLAVTSPAWQESELRGVIEKLIAPATGDSTG